MVTTRRRRYPSSGIRSYNVDAVPSSSDIATAVDTAVHAAADRASRSSTASSARRWSALDADQALAQGTSYLSRSIQMPLSGQIARPSSDRMAKLAAAGLAGAGIAWAGKKIVDRIRASRRNKAKSSPVPRKFVSRRRRAPGSIRRIVGRGDYWSDGTARQVLHGIGGALGAGLGAFGGGPMGPAASFLGGAAGLKAGYEAADTFGHILGMGDYTVKYNSLMPMNMGHPVPTFGDLRQATIIRHREFIKDVSVPANPALFTNDVFVLNPGSVKTFPWLSQIAANYDQYQFLGCVFNFKSTAGDTSSFALGTVVIASDYDVSDAPYANKNVMEQSQYCVSAKATVDQIHPIECDPTVGFVPIKYVDHGDTTMSAFEKRTADHCNVQVATVGLPGGSSGVIGELWVSYEVALYKPAVPISSALTVGGGGLADHYSIGNTFTSADPLGAAGSNPPVLRPGSNLGTSVGIFINDWAIRVPAGFPDGNYCLEVFWVGASTVLTNAVVVSDFYADTFLNTAEITPLNNLFSGAGATTSLAPGVTSAIQYSHLSFNVSGLKRDAFLVISAGTLPGLATFGELFIYKLPSTLTT